MQTDKNDMKVEKSIACIYMRSNERGTPNSDWYQIAQRITYFTSVYYLFGNISIWLYLILKQCNLRFSSTIEGLVW